MATLVFVAHWLLLILITRATVSGQDVYVIYSNGATSERTLPVCGSPRSACNLIQKRFWLSSMVTRLCKCPDRSECPWTWAEVDKYTIMINSRAQLKFCGQVGDLPNCTPTETAAVMERLDNSVDHLTQMTDVNCYCPTLHYFERQFFNISHDSDGNAVRREYYRCRPLPSCAEGDFCGYITTKLYETYHICTCPYQNICILENRQKFFVMQPLYEGYAYRGICTAYSP